MPSFHFRHRNFSLLVLLPLLFTYQAHARDVLCREGNANFNAEIRNGVKVHVGASRSGDLKTLATRTCAGKLTWEKQELPVTTGAWQLDLDAFGVDFGDGVPAAAFEIKKSESDCCSAYRIYSLEKPPKLVRTLVGGEFYNASDVDLDGRVEIWTNDAAVVDGFEKLSLVEVEPPTIVFRFEHGKLLDVSAEFRPYFDDEITRISNEIPAKDLQEFASSDGRLAQAPTPDSAEKLHRLRVAKTKVLEIVWAYLYSGREPDAWNYLAEMWPAADTGRIRAAILKARLSGLHSQADGTSTGPSPLKKKQVRIFDMDRKSVAGLRSQVDPPHAILLELPPEFQPTESKRAQSQLVLDLIIDAAGKVRSVNPPPESSPPTPDQIALAQTWKFIPALRDGKPVASRLRVTVSPKQ